MSLFHRVIEQYGGFENAIEIIGEPCLDAYCDKKNHLVIGGHNQIIQLVTIPFKSFFANLPC